MKKVQKLIGLTPAVSVAETKTTDVDQSSENYIARQAEMQTIQTSAKGILSANNTSPKRKKLLGD